MSDPKPAMTMREIREALGHVKPGVPDATVLPTSYVVSCLPIGHDSRWEFTISVLHQADGLYAVQHSLRYWGTDGTWSFNPGWDEEVEEHQGAAAEWLAAHRFDHDTALRIAKEQAPRLVYRGLTVAEVLDEGVRR